MLKTTPIQSAKNSPLDMAEDAEVGSRINFTTRLAKNLWTSVDIAEDAEVSEGDSSNDKTVERSLLSKKSNILTGYIPSLHSKKRWVSLDSFWLLLKLSIKSTIGKAIKQNSCEATQCSYPNQFLQKLRLHRYNKLSSCQVCRIYELFWYHFTLIIKLQLLATSTLLTGTSFLSLTP